MSYQFTAEDRKRAVEARANSRLFGKPEKPAPKPRHVFTQEERRLGGIRGYKTMEEKHPEMLVWLKKHRIGPWTTRAKQEANTAFWLDAKNWDKLSA